MIMNKGTRESRIPATELLTCCCAIGNKNMGIKFPIAPPTTTQGINFLGITLKFRIPNPHKTKPATVNLKAPTSKGEKETKLCFIRINELPQVSDNTAKMTHFNEVECNVCELN